MSTTFFLIRHGEVNNPQKIAYGRTAIFLSKYGKLQLKHLAEKLKRLNIRPSVIISSDLRRTIQSTEEIIKIFPSVPVFYTKDLEEVDIGGLTGRFLKYQNSIGDIYNSEKCKNMHIERPESIINRQLQILINANKKYFGKTIFVIGHQQPFQFLMWKLLNPSKKKIASIIGIQKEFQLENGAAWEVVLDDNLKVVKYSLIC